MTEQQNTRPSASREIAVKPLTFSDGGYAHNGLGTMYRITFHNDANIGWVLYRHEGSSKTGLGAHEDRDELITLACEDNERRILSAIDTTPSNTDPIAKDDELRKVQGGWRGVPISTFERLPEKPGKRSYEHVRCLIFIKGEWEVGMWNCEHLVWDDDEGDDFRYHPTEPTHWMPLPPTPTEHPTEQPSVSAGAVDALAAYQQADQDGIMVLVSRQAIEECLPALRSLAQEGE